MRVGYARVSTNDQDVARQLDLFTELGVDRVVSEKTSGDKYKPELEQLVTELGDGDALIVDDLDRLSRSLKEQLNLLDTLGRKGVEFWIGRRRFDYLNAGIGEFYELVMRGASAEGQVRTIRENTKKGIAAYRKRNNNSWGRKPSLDKVQREHVIELYGGGKTVTEIARIMRVSRPTIYRVIEKKRAE